MLSFKVVMRSFSSLALGFITTLIVFGVLLAILWAVIPESPAWELTGALISSALALCAGGFVVAWLSRKPDWSLPAAFGLFFGGISFIYILGPTWIVLISAAASALLTALGGLFFLKIAQKGTTQAGP